MDELNTNQQQTSQPLDQNVGVPDVATAAWNTEASVVNGQVQATTVGNTNTSGINIASGVQSTPMNVDTSGMTTQGQNAMSFQQQYQQALNNQTIQNYQNAFDQAYATQQNANGQIDQTYQQSAQDISNQYAIYRQNMGMNIANQGLNTGLGSQMQLSLSNSRNNALGQNSIAHAQAVQAGQQALVDLELQYRTAIAEAIGNNDLTMAQTLYEEIQNDENRKLVIAQTMAQYGDYSGYQDIYGSATAEEMQKAYDEAKKESKDIENAEYLAQLGDFSGLADYYDWTDDQYASATAQWIYANPGYAYYAGLITAEDYYAITGQLPTTGTSTGTGSYSSGYGSYSGGSSSGSGSSSSKVTATEDDPYPLENAGNIAMDGKVTGADSTAEPKVNVDGSKSTKFLDESQNGVYTYTSTSTGGTVTKKDGKYYDERGNEVDAKDVTTSNTYWDTYNASNFTAMGDEANAVVADYFKTQFGDGEVKVTGMTQDDKIVASYDGKTYLLDVDPDTGKITLYDNTTVKDDSNTSWFNKKNTSDTWTLHNFTPTGTSSSVGTTKLEPTTDTTTNTTTTDTTTTTGGTTGKIGGNTSIGITESGDPTISAALSGQNTNPFENIPNQEITNAIKPYLDKAIASLQEANAKQTACDLLDEAEVEQITGKFIGVNTDQYRPTGSTTASSITTEEAGGNVWGLGGKDSLGNEGMVTDNGQSSTEVSVNIGLDNCTVDMADTGITTDENGNVRSKAQQNIAGCIAAVTGNNNVSDRQVAWAMAVIEANNAAGVETTAYDMVDPSTIVRSTEDVQKMVAYNEEVKDTGLVDYFEKFAYIDREAETDTTLGEKVDLQQAFESGSVDKAACQAITEAPLSTLCALTNVRNHMWDTGLKGINYNTEKNNGFASTSNTVFANLFGSGDTNADYTEFLTQVQEESFGKCTDRMNNWAFITEMELEWVMGSKPGNVTDEILNLFINKISENVSALGDDATKAQYAAAIDSALIFVGQNCNPNFNGTDYAKLYNYQYDYVSPYTIDKTDVNYVDFLTAGYSHYKAEDVTELRKDQYDSLYKALGYLDDNGNLTLKGQARREKNKNTTSKNVGNVVTTGINSEDIDLTKSYTGDIWGSNGIIQQQGTSAGGLSTGTANTGTVTKAQSRAQALKNKMTTSEDTTNAFVKAAVDAGWDFDAVANNLNGKDGTSISAAQKAYFAYGKLYGDVYVNSEGKAFDAETGEEIKNWNYKTNTHTTDKVSGTTSKVKTVTNPSGTSAYSGPSDLNDTYGVTSSGSWLSKLKK